MDVTAGWSAARCGRLGRGQLNFDLRIYPAAATLAGVAAMTMSRMVSTTRSG